MKEVRRYRQIEPNVKNERVRQDLRLGIVTMLGHDITHPISIRSSKLTIAGRRFYCYQVYTTTKDKVVVNITRKVASVILLPVILDKQTNESYMQFDEGFEALKARISTALQIPDDEIVITRM